MCVVVISLLSYHRASLGDYVGSRKRGHREVKVKADDISLLLNIDFITRMKDQNVMNKQYIQMLSLIVEQRNVVSI